jgi:DNA-binding transcriptional MerR regulator
MRGGSANAPESASRRSSLPGRFTAPGHAREDFAEEWRAELAFMLRDTAGLPLTRLLRGTRYAMSLLWASRGLARELSDDETGVYRDTKPASSAEEVPSLVPSLGYRGLTACAASGITYRQLDYWARTGLVQPSLYDADGPGSQRLYSFRDILILKVVKRLLDTGISLQQIHVAARHVHDRESSDLAKLTLMSDGESVYECLSPDEVVDLLQGNQGVFGIALGRIWRETEGALADLPAERAEEPRE